MLIHSDLAGGPIPVRGLSMHQPWASLVAYGAKRIETRSWRTSYRGLVAIHATLKAPDSGLIRDLAFADAVNQAMGGGPLDRPLTMEHGVILAVAELLDCLSTGSRTMRDGTKPCLVEADYWVTALSGAERLFGDYSPDRYGWMFGRIVRLPHPIPYRGTQGLWTVDPEISQQLTACWARETTP